MYALREGLARLAEEGLEKSWSNHRSCVEMLWEGVEKLGLQLFVTDKVFLQIFIWAFSIIFFVYNSSDCHGYK